MCVSPLLVKFENKFHPKQLYGIGNPLPYKLVKKGKSWVKQAVRFAPVPFGAPPICYTGLWTSKVYIKIPDLEEVARANNDNPLGLSSRSCGLYKRFLYSDGESLVVCMYVPCGKCSECVRKKMNDWTFKVQHDMQSTKDLVSFFLTLTFKPKALPVKGFPSRYAKIDIPLDEEISCSTGLLDYTEFQLFMKRLRITLKRYYGVVDIHYFCCGEYGKKTCRPHFHVVLWFSQTPEMLSSRPFTNQKGGRHSFMSDLCCRLGRIPALNDSFFKSIAFRCWHNAERSAFDCQPVRNANATARYICKYIGKTKLFLPPELHDAFAPLVVPPFYRSSLRLASNWAHSLAYRLTSVANPYESYSVKYEKNGQTLEYLQAIPVKLYEYAASFRIEKEGFNLENMCPRCTFVAARIARYAAMENLPSPSMKERDSECLRSLALSNLQMIKYSDE